MVIKTRIKDTNNTATAQVRIKELNFDFAFDEVNLISATRPHFCQTNNSCKQYTKTTFHCLQCTLQWSAEFTKNKVNFYQITKQVIDVVFTLLDY